MSKKILFLPLLALAVTLACQTLLGTPTPPPSAPRLEPTRQAPGAVTPSATKGFTDVRLHKSGGSLATQLAAEAQKAAALGQQPVVEFDAAW